MKSSLKNSVGKTKISSRANAQSKVFLAIIVTFIASALLIGGVLALTGTIQLNSPIDNLNTTSDNNTLAFNFTLLSNDNATADCTLYIDSNAVKTANVANNTPTVFYSNTSWTEAAHTWFINCTNGTTISSATRTFTYDLTPPTTTDDAPTGWQNSAFTVTLTPTDTLTGVVSTQYKIDVGTWQTGTSISINTDGNHTIQYNSTDYAGNIEATKTTYAALDTTAPTVTLAAPANAIVTNSTTIQFNYSYTDAYSATANCNLTVYNSTSSAIVVLSDVANNNSDVINSTTITNDDTYSWNVTCVDHVGNTGNSATRTFTIDTTLPSIILNFPTNNTFIAPGTIINFTITDTNLDTVTYQINGGTTQTFASPYNIDTTGWADGTYTIVVNANDTAGNANSDTFKFTIDGTPPTTTANAGTYTFGNWTNQAVTVTLSATDTGSGVDTILYCTDTTNTCTPNQAYSTSITISTEGTSYIRFLANDSVGNTETVNSETIMIDTTAPNATLASPINANLSSKTVNFQYTIPNDGKSNSNCNLTVYYSNGTQLSGVYQYDSSLPPGSTVTPTLTMPNDGVFLWNVTCTDDAGNLGTSTTESFTVDTINPDVQFITPIDGARIIGSVQFIVSASDTLTGIDPSTIVINASGTIYSMTLSQGGDKNNGNYTVTIDTTMLTDGWNTFEVYVDDYAGNSNNTVNITLYVDNTPPTITLINPQDNSYNNTGTLNITFSADDTGASTVGENMHCEIIVYFNSTNQTQIQNPYTPGAQVTKTFSLPQDVYTWEVYCNDRQDDSGNNLTTALRTYTIDLQPVNISDVDTTPDMFACVIPGHNVNSQITFVVSAIDIGPAGVDWVKANISEINNSAPLLDMAFNGVDWVATITINDTSNYDFRDLNITFTARDKAGNDYYLWNGIDPFTTVILYNMTTPPLENETCERTTSNTTNFCDELDFNNINFIMEVERNGSAECNPETQGRGLPWGDTFAKVITLNFTSVNFSDPNIGQKMERLGGAIRPHITPPGEFGDSWIYVNTTAFNELNTVTTITMYGLPFANKPNITGPGAVTFISWIENTPYNISGMIVPNGDLTFSVGGFSQYNITDVLAPTITINTPTGTITDTTPLVNVSVNGTGTMLSYLEVSIDGTILLSYNSTEIQQNCVDTSTNGDWESVICTTTSSQLEGGEHDLVVYAADFGGEEPGNNATEASVFVVDTTPPIVSGIEVNNITNASAIIIFSTDENAVCFVEYGLNNSLGTKTALDSLSTAHSFTLNGLSEGTRYYYNINCTDNVNNTNTAQIDSFVTAVTETNSLDNTTTTTVEFNITENGTEKTLLELEINTATDINATIEVLKYDENPEAADLSVLDIGLYIEIESNELNSSTLDWIVIKAYYNESELPSGIDETSLRLYWYNNATGIWEEVTPGGVNTIENYVWGNTTHLSTYSVGGELTTTESGTSGGGGGGGVAPSGENMTWEEQIFTTPLTVGDVVKFTFNNEEHTIELTSLGVDYAILKIASEPITLTINVGETKWIDIDGDGTDDIKIYFEKVELGKAYFTLEKLFQPTSPETGEETVPQEPQLPEERPKEEIPITEQPQPTEGLNVNTIIIIVLLAIAMAVVYYFITQKKK